jgi:hypothetical protein
MTNWGHDTSATEALVSVIRDGREESLRRNREVDWDEFDPSAYWEHNYKTLRNDDQSIIQSVAGFFSRHFQNAGGIDLLRGLDVGSGANLYPALGLLPWSGRITLTDLSPGNVDWLGRAAAGIGVDDADGAWVWQPFWVEYARFGGYQQLANPRTLLAARHEVRRIDVFDLPRANWDLGTMFFVAESITSYPDEFDVAIESFLRALVPGAPFAAAFMESSIGYVIAGRSFPAVRQVGPEMLERVFARFAAEVEVNRIDVRAQNPAQDGYEGMIVVTGTTGHSGQPPIHPTAR